MWDIFAYQNASSLSALLNAIASVCGAADFKSALMMAAFFGFVAAGLASALAPQKLAGWQWLASVTLVLTILFVPRATVRVTDVTLVEAPRVIANVPFGLAILAGTTSAIGHALTSLFETAMQSIPDPSVALPAELSYARNGLVFGSRMVSRTMDAAFVDPVFRADLVQYVSNCVMPDLDDGHIDPATFAASTDLWSMIGTPNPARFAALSAAGGGTALVTCPEAYALLNGRLPSQLDALLSRVASRAHPTLPAAEAQSRIEAELASATQMSRIVAAGVQAKAALQQAAIINDVRASKAHDCHLDNDAGCLAMAAAQAQALAATNSAYINNAKVAEQALPVVRNVIEALTYALFPLVILLLMLSSGRDTIAGLKNYATVLIWIQLWPPLYAILNYMATLYANYDIAAAAAMQAQTGISLMTHPSISGTALSAQAMVGYLTVSIPVLAWAALKRMENFGTAVAGGMAQLQSAVQSAGGAFSAGNNSWGNQSYDQINASSRSTSPFVRSTQDGMTGAVLTTVGNGQAFHKAEVNSGPGRLIIQSDTGTQKYKEAQKAVSLARTESERASRSASAALTARLGFISGDNHADTGSTTGATVDAKAASQAFDRAAAIADRVTKGTSLAIGDGTSVSTQLGIGPMGSKGGQPGGGAGGKLGIVAAFLKGGLGTDTTWTDQQRHEFAKARDSLTKEEVRDLASAMQTISSTASREVRDGNSSGKSKETAAALTRTLTAESASSKQLTDAESVADGARSNVGKGEALSYEVSATDEETWKSLNLEGPRTYEERGRSLDDQYSRGQVERMNYLNTLNNASPNPVPTHVAGAPALPASADQLHQRYHDPLKPPAPISPSANADVNRQHNENTGAVNRAEGAANRGQKPRTAADHVKQRPIPGATPVLENPVAPSDSRVDQGRKGTGGPGSAPGVEQQGNEVRSEVNAALARHDAGALLGSSPNTNPATKLGDMLAGARNLATDGMIAASPIGPSPSELHRAKALSDYAIANPGMKGNDLEENFSKVYQTPPEFMTFGERFKQTVNDAVPVAVKDAFHDMRETEQARVVFANQHPEMPREDAKALYDRQRAAGVKPDGKVVKSADTDARAPRDGDKHQP